VTNVEIVFVCNGKCYNRDVYSFMWCDMDACFK